MSKELRAAGLEAKFSAILEQAEELTELDSTERAREHRAFIGIVESYNSARESFVDVTGLQEYLDSVELSTEHKPFGFPDYGSQLQQVIANSRSAVEYLGRGREQVPAEVKDTLNSLADSIAIVQKVNPNLHDHLLVAIHEHESTHYLAASVLAAKAIDYILTKLEGTDELAKADNLVRKGLLKPDLKDGFVRTWKKARNYYVHDITTAPSADESLSILPNACQLAVMYVKSQ